MISLDLSRGQINTLDAFYNSSHHFVQEAAIHVYCTKHCPSRDAQNADRTGA
jgi:hypothetical protein